LHDGHPDADTTPLANVKITLKSEAGQIVATTLTDADGNYFFENLLPGNYTLTEETPAGLIDADSGVGTINGIAIGDNPNANTITHIVMNGGDEGVNYNFCESQPASVSGHVYHDQNNNGVRDANETPIPGTTVALIDASGTQIATTTTDSTGFYKFSGLSAGTYQIHEIQPSPWFDGKDAAGTILGQFVGTAQNPATTSRASSSSGATTASTTTSASYCRQHQRPRPRRSRRRLHHRRRIRRKADRRRDDPVARSVRRRHQNHHDERRGILRVQGPAPRNLLRPRNSAERLLAR